MKIFKFVLSATFIATTTLSPLGASAGTVTVTTSKETASQPTGSTTSGTIPSASDTSGVNDSANDASSTNSKGSGMSSMMGTALTTSGSMMIAKGTASKNYGLVAAGVVLVGMGMLSFKQSAADKGVAGTAAITGLQSDGLTDSYATSGGLSSGNSTEADAAAAKAISDLAKAGIYNAKTGTITAGGKTYKASDFSSPSAMQAAGIPQGAISGAYDYANKESKKIAEKVKLGAMTAANGFEDGSGGGSGGGGSAFPGGDPSADGAMAGAGSLNAGSLNGREPTNFAGMQKNYNGEPIGVAADSIFHMMTRRYKVKESQESFFNEAELALKK